MSSGVLHRAIVQAMPLLPRPLVWRFSRRYIAGTRLEDACDRVKELNDQGCTATIDVLGENSADDTQVRSAVDLYLRAIRDIHARSLDCGISVKLSDLGLRVDVPMATDAASTLLATAARHGQFLRIDMEDSSVTDLTLDVYRVLRSRFDNVGIVLQSCLRRSRRDLQELLRDGPADIRLCKGIYLEPEQIAYRNPDEIRNSFKEILVQFIEGGGSRIGIATHDPQLVAHAEETISKLGVGRGRYEFQMLLGVAGDLRRELVERGHPLRIYVPFGQRWYEYSMRRLRENPQIAAHVLRNLFTAG